MGPAGFPGDMILAGKMVEVKLTDAVGRADVLDRRLADLISGAAVFRRAEAELIDLCVRVVYRRANMQRVTDAYRNEENIRKNQRVRRFDGRVCTGEDALLLDPSPVWTDYQLEVDFAQLLIVKGHKVLSALELERMRVEIVGVRRINRVFHRLEPVAPQHFADIDFLHAVLTHQQIPFRQ